MHHKLKSRYTASSQNLYKEDSFRFTRKDGGRERSRSRSYDRSMRYDRKGQSGVESQRGYAKEEEAPKRVKKSRWDVMDPAVERGLMRQKTRYESHSALHVRSPRDYDENNYRYARRENFERSSSSGKRFPRSRSRSRSRSPSRPHHNRSRHRSHTVLPASSVSSIRSRDRQSRQERRGRQHSRSSSPSSRSSSSSRYPSRKNRGESKHKRDDSRDSKGKRHKDKGKDTSRKKRERSPKEDRRSVLTGKKIKMKVHKSAEDHERDANREKLLSFLNSAYE